MKPLTLSFLAFIFSIGFSAAQNGYIQKAFQLPMSNESRPYFVQQVGTDYVLNGDIIVGNTLQKTMLYQNNDKDRYIWPKGEIAIKLDESIAKRTTLRNNQNLKQLALEAIGIFNQQTNLRLVGYHGQKDYINIKFSSDTTYGGLSPVGRVGGEQVIWVTDRASLAALLHEMMHSFGFWHEQNRYDRDNYVDIDTNKAFPRFRYAFQIEPGSNVTAYDYFSVMHYPEDAFAMKNGDRTIRCKKNNVISDCTIGGGNLSAKDIAGINTSYFYNASIPRVTYHELSVQQASTVFNNGTSLGKMTNTGMVPIQDGVYKIKINQTGKYLAIEGISKDNGARLVQWDYVEQGNHQFNVRKVNDRIYSISAVHSNRYINAAGQSREDGTAVIQWDYANQDNVKWELRYYASNEGSKPGWVIVNLHSMTYLSLASFSGTTNGEPFIIQQQQCGDGSCSPVQTFSFEPVPQAPLKLKEDKLYQNSPGMINKVKGNQ